MDGRSKQGFYGLLVLLGGASYGCVSAVVKLAYAHGFSAVDVTLGQYYYAAVILWVSVWGTKAWRSSKIAGADFVRLFALGVFGAGTALLYYEALSTLPAWLAIILLFQFSWMTFVVDYVVTRKKPSMPQWIGIICILIGTMLAADISHVGGAHSDTVGILLGLASGLSYALFLYINATVSTQSSPVLRTAIITTVSALVVTLLEHPGFSVVLSVSHMWIYGVAIGLLSQAIPTLLFSIGIPRVGGSSSAILGSVELPVVVVLAVWILHEPVYLATWVGVLLILIGITFGERARVFGKSA